MTISKKRSVLLQHGIFCNAAPWVILKNDSLGFLLADLGYDVWLSNSRGTTLSKNHKYYLQNDPEFWNFSYFEMGMYDLPAQLEYILSKNNNRKVIYIGQSMGTMLPYIYGSVFPESAQKYIKCIINLAPTLFLKHLKSVGKNITKFWIYIETWLKYFGIYEIFPQTTVTKVLFQKFCLSSDWNYNVCINMLFSLFGSNYEQLRPDTLSLILGHYPAGTSMKTLVHLFQNIDSGEFANYDYGKEENLRRYNQSQASIFNISKIQIPSYIFYSENDYTGPAQGAILMFNLLSNVSRAGLYKIRNSKFNHIDFLFAKDVYAEIYVRLLEILKKYL